ncbi:histidinol-phosphatase HisJ family protein [Aminipila butyrica]|uniref:Histidinol-phosphatase n=1 Tax=Aminipila butyrica TaxID=433296 RepID=A0A858BV44_9FIRM|nr:histidinol-phosphatase HisJ family protein [Aminipila butyrica]QIB69467.1 histidinol-phosphatase HisJ family protein [Aminipila butyrica]
MYDYHTHSFFSDDCNIPLERMIASAIAKGVKELAVTDHYDPDYPDSEYPFILDFDAYHKALIQAQEQYSPQIQIIKGLEIGIQHGETMNACQSAAQAFPYDFILGSFHCTDHKDLYQGYFTADTDIPKAFERYYEYAYECLKEYRDFDVMGHINVVDRYVPFEKIPSYKPYMELIRAILQLLIENGKGIEFNASCYRYLKNGRTTPTKEILQAYRELGGEIITFGSDAHNPESIADHYQESLELLRTVGFKYLSTFKERQVQFLSI